MERRLSSIAQTSQQSRTATFLSLVKEAIFGSRQDFTAISINRAIILLAVPMVLEMAMEALFGIVAIFWVAHLGADATATVATTQAMLLMSLPSPHRFTLGTPFLPPR